MAVKAEVSPSLGKIPGVVRTGPPLDEHLPSKAGARDGQLSEPESSRLLHAEGMSMSFTFLGDHLAGMRELLQEWDAWGQQPKTLRNHQQHMESSPTLKEMHIFSFPKKSLPEANPSMYHHGKVSTQSVSREGCGQIRGNFFNVFYTASPPALLPPTWPALHSPSTELL